MNRVFFSAAFALILAGSAAAEDGRIPVVAAENFYGEVASAVGGDRVEVVSVLTNAVADPHDFEPSPSVAQAIADAGLVVFNGADYDHWVERILDATARPERKVVEAAPLIGIREGDNPHAWYDPRLMPSVATAIADALSALDPSGATGYRDRAAAYAASLGPIAAKVDAIRGRFGGATVTATEPVFGYMANALGFTDTHPDFQRAIMNESEPAARDIAAVEDDLRGRRVKALIYNTQVEDPLTEQLLAVAREAGVPVVGVTETVPAGLTYGDWMLGQLNALEKALAAPSS